MDYCNADLYFHNCILPLLAEEISVHREFGNKNIKSRYNGAILIAIVPRLASKNIRVIPFHSLISCYHIL